jgi:hypothetical protein
MKSAHVPHPSPTFYTEIVYFQQLTATILYGDRLFSMIYSFSRETPLTLGAQAHIFVQLMAQLKPSPDTGNHLLVSKFFVSILQKEKAWRLGHAFFN